MKVDIQGQKAEVLDQDPRDSNRPVNEAVARKPDDLSPLVAWVMSRVEAWRNHRRANYEWRWDEYERLWRGIWSGAEQKRKSERSRIITPALSEAVENAVSEIEEAVFGRGDFFEIKAEISDPEELVKATEHNKNCLREDLARLGFTPNVSDALINSAVYGTGIGEILVEDFPHREIVPTMGENGRFEMAVIEEKHTVGVLRSVNPRNFLIDPLARTIEDGLGCAIEENVGAHTIRKGQEDGVYRQVSLEATAEDILLSADPQEITPYTQDSIPVIRYYGLVPEHLLLPPGEIEELFPGDHKQVEPAQTRLVEAIVVLAHGSVCLKAETSPHLMRDRSVVAFAWDVIPGRFWGRGVCEKGATPQKLLDAEFRSRVDALAYTGAPMMGIDASRLPRGFKLDVYPGKSVLTNGDPSTILKPFTFGQVDQNTYQQAQALDLMVQRATGAVDGISMAQRGAGGEARSGAVSMSMAGIVKRSKRTLLRFVDHFMQPALRKLMWRNMQYGSGRYLPFNFSFNVTSTMGIMQREYETMTLTQLLQTMEPGSEEYLTLLIGIIGNTGLPNRTALIDGLRAKLQQMQEQASMAAQLAQTAEGQPPPVDPADQALKAAKAQESQARARLIMAQTQNEVLEPQFRAREVAMKGVYQTPEEQIAREFDRRLKIADQMIKKQDIESNERIADKQVKGSILAETLKAKAAAVSAPAPAPVVAPAPVLIGPQTIPLTNARVL